MIEQILPSALPRVRAQQPFAFLSLGRTIRDERSLPYILRYINGEFYISNNRTYETVAKFVDGEKFLDELRRMK